MGDEDAERKRGRMKTRVGHEQPGGHIMQRGRERALRRRDGVKGKLKGWSAHWKMTWSFGENRII